MVNAASATQALLDNFNIESIVFSGIAGGISDDYHVGDVMVPERWASYNEVYYAREIGGVFPQPFPIPGVYDPAPDIDATQHFNMSYPMGTYMTNVASAPDVETLTTWIYADPVLLAKAQSIVGSVILAQSGMYDSRFLVRLESNNLY